MIGWSAIPLLEFQTSFEVMRLTYHSLITMRHRVAGIAPQVNFDAPRVFLKTGRECVSPYGVGVLGVNPQRLMSPTNADSVRNASHLPSIGSQIR